MRTPRHNIQVNTGISAARELIADVLYLLFCLSVFVVGMGVLT